MKSYFANSVQAAMAQARQELDADALLVTSRPAPPEASGLGAYEVVFATDLPDTTASLPATAAAEGDSAAPASGPTFHSMLSELRELKTQVRAMRRSITQPAEGPLWIPVQAEVAELYGMLVGAEVDRDLAQGLVNAVQSNILGESTGGPAEFVKPFAAAANSRAARRPAPVPADKLHALLRAEVQKCLTMDGTLGMPGGTPKLVALIGPPGAGKTATLAKIAVRYGLQGRRPAQFLSLDTLRVGAAEQLRSYAAILGIGCQVLGTAHALAQAIEEHRNKELILIDTPGLTLADLEGGNDTADFLARRTDIQKHLVLPATMRAADILRAAYAYEAFLPSRLIFTRLDETETFGPILSEAARSERPISFFGTGQRVPEDLEPATTAALADRLLGAVPHPQNEQSAA